MLLKYGRTSQLIVELESILRLLAQITDSDRVNEWILAIGVYVMAVNKEISQLLKPSTTKCRTVVLDDSASRKS